MQDDFDDYIEKIEKREIDKIIITRDGKDLVHIVPYQDNQPIKKVRLGAGKGIISDPPDNFDDIDPEIEAMFYNMDDFTK